MKNFMAVSPGIMKMEISNLNKSMITVRLMVKLYIITKMVGN